MLTLYYKPTCAFSQSVLAEAEDLNLKFNLKDVSTDPVLEKELVDRGGKDQTPYLVDPEKNTEMYESKDIIDYLYANYGEGKAKETFGGLRIHQSEDTCDTCQ